MSDKAERVGVIHDTGYARYEGGRAPQSRRFWVISRHVLRSAIRQKWSVGVPLLLAGATMVIGAGVMIAFGRIEGAVRGPAGAMLPRADLVLLGAGAFFQLWGFVLAVTAGTPAIAEDLQTGAFQFYFSRPLRTGDYIRGKLLGLTLLIGLSTLAGPMLMAIVRVGAAEDAAAMWKALPIIPRSFVVGLASTLSLVMPAAAVGALLRKKNAAIAAYLVYGLVVANVAEGLAHVFKEPMIALISTDACVTAIGYMIYDLPPDENVPHPGLAALSIMAFSLAGYLLIRWRVRSMEGAGIGGGS